MKTLFFEGAGCVPRGDVENCRIRTAFYNKEGRAIYLELSGIERNKYTAKSLACYDNIGFVDYCHYITEDLDDCNHSRAREVPTGLLIERKHYEYSKQGILEFVNDILFCDFDDIKICDLFDGYRVHRDTHDRFGNRICEIKTGFDKYNFMETFPYHPELSEARRDAFNKYDEIYKSRTGRKYSILSVSNFDDQSMTLQSYANKEKLREAELPRSMTLYLNELEGSKFEYHPRVAI